MYLVHALGLMNFEVNDLGAAVKEATDIIGLRLVHQADGLAVLTSNARRAELVYRQAANTAPARVASIGLQAYDAAAVEKAADRAEAAGWRLLSKSPSIPMVDRSVTLATEEGLIFEIHTPVPEDQPVRYPTLGVKPQKLDHVGPKTTNTVRLSQQLNDILGLKVSEHTSGNELCFLRAGNGQHHTCSLIQDTAPGVHHYAWAFWHFNDFLGLGDALESANKKLTYGPGRHGPGDNLYSYHIDGNGFMIECCAEMETVDHDSVFQTRVWEINDPRLINRWGVAPPAEWLSHRTGFGP
jgi:catechol 2,3-dioxygenase